ncbi:two-component system OmpR family sensor histidine kinase KdpD [Vibrio cholerae]|nr:two-component system OmpR family sensor histidine kinase KdpD [Vibrio cholerae]
MIVAAHQGSIRVHNRESGGACFTVTIPCRSGVGSCVKASHQGWRASKTDQNRIQHFEIASKKYG